ncbi:NUDIX hydrolase [Echinimonas agarilytica]|uniref:CoA pyrophosphatase n=1 Tax=Echinimonas agarilytica TaxID=1215918 RepID=A0AA42B7M0_9GAMM|nr:CoA pyrophosphatase [Echinimonas agarilytica]MCM2679779.1 CoA pyrophosphatase [Echinimonas agarilytica]
MSHYQQHILSRYCLSPISIADHQADFDHQAAVLIPLIKNGDDYDVLFTIRAAHLRHHGGQISFPGGRHDHSDPTLCHTAVRECIEEIGAKPDYVLGSLPRYISNSGFEITPFLGVFEQFPTLKLSPDEVDSSFSVPLSFLLDARHHVCLPIQKGHRILDVYWIAWNGHYIWGVTAGIIHTLYSHIKGINVSSERAARYPLQR